MIVKHNTEDIKHIFATNEVLNFTILNDISTYVQTPIMSCRKC